MKFKFNIAIVMFLSVISCTNNENNVDENKSLPILKELEGKYSYTYPSGQIEIVTIKLDSSYTRSIYITKLDFEENKKPHYCDEETWSISGKKLRFNHWLAICELGRFTDSILPKPFYASYLDALWHPSNENDVSFINIYDDSGYILKKITP
jgi:hypothetical protein